jgi:hypothetical protein
MDQAIAVEILHDEVERLRALAYEVLVERIGHPECLSKLGRDGCEYVLESEGFWDSRKGGDVRVIVSIEDGGLSSLFPTTEDFIKAPDGSFVGESKLSG